jgi:peptide/nickel transport system ATP-binding protein
VSEPILQVEGLQVGLRRGPLIVEEAAFALRPGEALGVVGESGSGKTTVAQALLGYTRPGLEIPAGSVRVAGEEMIGRSEDELRGLRGRLISYVPQDPATSLNPSIRVGDQVREILRVHGRESGEDAQPREILERVELPGDHAFQRRYPHQLSGGQQQRLAIAVALACEPSVIVLDEPTTGLDVVTQARILEEIARLQRESSVALVYVSHDLAVVASIAGRIAVMYAGRIVEDGPSEAVIGAPRHPYTLGLISSVPDHVVPRRLVGISGVAVGVGDRPPGCAFAPRCAQRVAACEEAVPGLVRIGDMHSVRCIRWEATPAPRVDPRGELAGRLAVEAPLLLVAELRAEHRGRYGSVVAADDVTFQVVGGECVALVGESGSGKTTIARCVVGLHAPSGGRILLDGNQLGALARNRSRHERRSVQIVFQNPYDSLNPRRSVEDAVSWPARSLRDLSQLEARNEVATLLERVRLPERMARRYPGELSGGERQRVAIARALAARPSLLICDEVTSALDVSVQAAVLDLLAELRRELDLSVLFITHDLGVVASIAERVLVLDAGVVCEQGDVDTVLFTPKSDYTRRLIAAAPSLAVGNGEAPSAVTTTISSTLTPKRPAK